MALSRTVGHRHRLRLSWEHDSSREPVRPFRTVRARLLSDGDHYDELVQRIIGEARTSVWIATANVKEMRVEAPVGTRARAKGRYQSILDTFDSLISRGVELRLLHGGIPSRAFTAELARHPRLRKARLASQRTDPAGFMMKQCPRVHLKLIAVDGSRLYLGSANFTGAGLGAKGPGRRNFEMGVVTDDDVLLDLAQQRFERIWTGRECASCRLRRECPSPLDLQAGGRTITGRGRPAAE